MERTLESSPVEAEGGSEFGGGRCGGSCHDGNRSRRGRRRRRRLLEVASQVGRVSGICLVRYAIRNDSSLE